MGTVSLTLRDCATMLRRDFRHPLRNLALTLSALLPPVAMWLLSASLCGGAPGTGLHGGGSVNAAAPAILLMTAGSGAVCGSATL